MIELRWVVRQIPCDWSGTGEVTAVKDEIILQHRWRYYKLIRKDGRGGKVEEFGDWSDWHDVQTVKE